MKKLLMMLTVFSLAVTLNAQQTEDEIYIGLYPRGKTFGDFRSTDTRPIKGILSISGTVVGICKRDCCNRSSNTCSMLVQLSDSSIVQVNLLNSEFKVQKNIVGQTITVHGTDRNKVLPVRQRKDLNADRNNDIPFSATGIKII